MTYHLRRTDREITDPAHIDRLLSSARFCTIALCDGEEPYAVTLSCGFDAERRRLCFHVAREGRKLDLVARNPRACATVVADLGYKSGECAHPYESVVVFGTMHLIEDAEDKRLAMRALLAQLEPGEGSWEAFDLENRARFDSFEMLALDIERATAKAGE